MDEISPDASASNVFTNASADIPMIGSLTSMDQLLEIYKDNAASPGFIPGIEYLRGKYNMRKIRGV